MINKNRDQKKKWRKKIFKWTTRSRKKIEIGLIEFDLFGGIIYTFLMKFNWIFILHSMRRQKKIKQDEKKKLAE